MSGCRARAAARNWMPLMPGIWRSETTTAKGPRSASATNPSWPRTPSPL